MKPGLRRFRPSARPPLAAGWALKRARELIDPLGVRRAEQASTAPDPVSFPGTVLPPAVRGRGASAAAKGSPIPPRRLRARTGAPGIREFTEGGRMAARELSSALEAGGGSLARVGSVLDFGCGSARVLPHIARLAPGARCSGCDVDSAAIEWAMRNRPGLQWSRSGFVPPLPFRARSFDLVYSISVLSHLDERGQDQWLPEVARVLRPGGVALLSVHGPHAFEQFRTARVRTAWCPAQAFDRNPLAADEFVFEPYLRSVWNRAELPGVGGGYGLAFHGGDYLRARWSATIEVVDVLEQAMTGWQDIVVCRKR
ncbi:MAG: class I SAM-dependent methyltransferase [Solirubrobacteraceae bacterium]